MKIILDITTIPVGRNEDTDEDLFAVGVAVDILSSILDEDNELRRAIEYGTAAAFYHTLVYVTENMEPAELSSIIDVATTDDGFDIVTAISLHTTSAIVGVFKQFLINTGKMAPNNDDTEELLAEARRLLGAD